MKDEIFPDNAKLIAREAGRQGTEVTGILPGTCNRVPVSNANRMSAASRYAVLVSVASGFIAAAIATIIGTGFSPEQPATATGALMRAVAYLAFVFGAAVTTTYIAFGVRRSARVLSRKEIAVRTAGVTMWLPPLWMFLRQSSPLVLIIWVIFVVEVARLVAFLSHLSILSQQPIESSSESRQFAILDQSRPYKLSVIGAFSMQGAIVASMSGHVVTAALLYLVASAVVAHRSFQMFRDLGAIHDPSAMERVWTACLSAASLIVFAWLPYIAVGGSSFGGGIPGSTGNLHFRTGGSGGHVTVGHHGAQRPASALAWLRSLIDPDHRESRSSSFAAARRIFDSRFPQDSTATGSLPKTTQNTNIPSTRLVTGPVFPGVELYPESQPQTKLVAPPKLGKNGMGISRSDPLSIPFDGVYWFWRGPSDLPPLNSVVMHGNPSAQFFRSTDGDGMSMEAKQNLGFVVDSRQYGAIEIDVRNADPFPHSVSIALRIRNTTVPEKPSRSLGMEDVSTPAASAGNASGRQTLRFRIPAALAMLSFDELTVSYYLRGARSDRSARIAIERFRLVPRGG